MTDTVRVKPGKRMSQAVACGDLVWLAGQCGTSGNSITEQTKEALEKIEKLLLETGSDRTRILNTTIWLANIDAYDEMNAVWDEWIPHGCEPSRACGETKLAGIGYDVEIICVASRN